MRNDLPFEITPQIKRYLDELVEFTDKFPSGEHDCVLETFVLGETISEYALGNISAFIKYMEKEGILRCNEMSDTRVFTEYENVVSDIKHKDDAHPKKWRANILDENMLRNIADFANNKTGAGITRINWNCFTRTLSHPNPRIGKSTFRKSSEKSCHLFDILWKNKKHMISEDVEFPGNPKDVRSVAVEIGLNLDTRRESYNDKGIKKTIAMAKSTIKAKKRKGYELFFTQKKDEILMILKE
jgi:hypothetical protein